MYRMSMYVVEPRAQQSTVVALSPLFEAVYDQVRADQSMYQKTYAYACLVPFFSWSMELLVFASRLFAPKVLDHLLATPVCLSNPSFRSSERSGRNRPLLEAPPPCTWYKFCGQRQKRDREEKLKIAPD